MPKPEQKSLAYRLSDGLLEAMRTPAVESAVGGAAGALLFRAMAGLSLNAVQGNTDPEYSRRLKRAATIIGAVAGAANPLVRDANYASLPSFFSSMTHKASSDYNYDTLPFMGTVDVDRSIGIINQDAFLNPYERSTAIEVVRRAPQVTKGTTSQYNLFRSAIGAGAAFVPAYAFGMLAGKALGLPTDTVTQLSRVGALAYAVRASGLMDQL